MRMVRGTTRLGSRLLAFAAIATLGTGLAGAPGADATTGSPGSSVVNAPVFTLPLKDVGQMNLTTLAASEHPRSPSGVRQGAPISRAAASSGRYREVDNQLIRHSVRSGTKAEPSPQPAALSTTNVPGEMGFSALGDVQQADTPGGLDLEPPDQGLCAGNGYVIELINNALAVYDQYGDQVIRPVAATAVFLQPKTDFFSDPRCYYDAPTHRWFLQEFVVGTVNSAGKEATPSLQFEAVSNGSDPTGSWTVWSWNTTDAGVKGCPCFGDYDNLGVDDNGIYVATDEFGVATSAYNGVIIYAISKAQLETVSQTGIVPPVFGYRLRSDPFGQPYIVAPTSTPPSASFAPNTEYFVESNSNRASDHHLLVYALHDTSQLTAVSSGPPSLYRTEVTTEPYAFPPDAVQKAGPRPLGQAYQDPAGQLQADFNAEMEPTYTDGHIYAELDTATAGGSDGVDWFILSPKLSGSTLSASVLHQGTVAVHDTSLLYPYTAVDYAGVGYLLFSMSGPHTYPSPGYIRYGADGPTGPVIAATAGAAPEDSFTCYSAFVGPNYGGCRWGDYSMGVVMSGRVYMATEYIPQGYRDTLANWGTYVWSAPTP
jgi:hypothetical protein